MHYLVGLRTHSTLKQTPLPGFLFPLPLQLVFIYKANLAFLKMQQ